MGLLTMTSEGELEVPTRGGLDKSEIARLESLIEENKQLAQQNRKMIEEIKETHATQDTYGLSRVTRRGDITFVDGGMAMSAVENNPSIEGTLANNILLMRYLTSIVCNTGITWDGTVERSQIVFYNYGGNNWAGMGVTGDGWLHIKVGISENFDFSVSPYSGEVFRNGIKLF